MTRRPGRSASNDPGLVQLLDAKADAVCFVAKASDYQVRVALETTLEENLASIRDSVVGNKKTIAGGVGEDLAGKRERQVADFRAFEHEFQRLLIQLAALAELIDQLPNRLIDHFIVSFA